MKYIILLVLSSIVFLGRAQQNISNDSVRILLAIQEEGKLQELNKYKDSLKTLSDEGIPILLYDVNLDITSLFFSWKTSTSEFLSLRVELFKMIENKDILLKLIQSPYFQTQFLNIQRRRVPSDSLTNVELARIRLKELRTKKNILDRIFFRKPRYWIPDGIKPMKFSTLLWNYTKKK